MRTKKNIVTIIVNTVVIINNWFVVHVAVVLTKIIHQANMHFIDQSNQLSSW